MTEDSALAADLDGDSVPDLSEEDLYTGVDVAALLDSLGVAPDDNGPEFGEWPSSAAQDDASGDDPVASVVTGSMHLDQDAAEAQGGEW